MAVWCNHIRVENARVSCSNFQLSISHARHSSLAVPPQSIRLQHHFTQFTIHQHYLATMSGAAACAYVWKGGAVRGCVVWYDVISHSSVSALRYARPHRPRSHKINCDKFSCGKSQQARSCFHLKLVVVVVVAPTPGTLAFAVR